MLPPIVLIGICALVIAHLWKGDSYEPVSQDRDCDGRRDGGGEPRPADQVDCRVTKIPTVISDVTISDPVISPEK